PHLQRDASIVGRSSEATLNLCYSSQSSAKRKVALLRLCELNRFRPLFAVFGRRQALPNYSPLLKNGCPVRDLGLKSLDRAEVNNSPALTSPAKVKRLPLMMMGKDAFHPDIHFACFRGYGNRFDHASL